MASLTYRVDFELHTCGHCGIQFAVPERWLDDRRSKHDTFYCPNGHPRVFAAESREEKLARERAEDETTDERRLRGVAAGVCPCCNRTFQQLARHMASKHPNVVAIKGA